MASETYKKRQKELARREKKQKKAARLAERRNKTEKTDDKLQEEKPDTEEPLFHLESKGKPIYFSRAATPGDVKRKSAITLYNVKSSNARGHSGDERGRGGTEPLVV